MLHVDVSPRELRRQAEHCRRLADSQFDERISAILRAKAIEFDEEAAEMDRRNVDRLQGERSSDNS